MNYSLSSQITPSIFETNQFLIDNKNTTLIEYAAFFGSIQIFQYLKMNRVELKPSLWLYAIHSKNPELIHLLESNKICPPKFMSNINNDNDKCLSNNYNLCLVQSIICHHNDFLEYIKDNLLVQNNEDSELKEKIISYCIEYHNFFYFQSNAFINHGFFSLCFYNYNKLVNLLLEKKEKEIVSKIIQ